MSSPNPVIPTGVRPSLYDGRTEWRNLVFAGAYLALALVVTAQMLCPAVLAQDLPVGWRRGNAVEKSSAWRSKSPSRFFRVEGDFDGDGKSDIAELLINPKEKKFAIFVKLASAQEWRMLGEAGDLGALDRFAIDIVKPGRYETACGKGYDDSFCAHGEPDYLVLSHPAIDFIYTESADQIFYWDSKTKAFREIAMSD